MSDNANKVKKHILIRAFVFMIVLTMPMLAWGIIKIVGIFAPSVIEKIDYDLGENRVKSKFPTSFNLETITSELEAYYNDRVPFRSVIITTNREINGAIEKPYNNTIGPFLLKLVYGEQNSQISDSTSDKELDELFGNESQDQETPGVSTKCEHKYVMVEVVEPDYEWYGYTLYSCSLCNNEIKSDFIDKVIDSSYMPLKVYNGITVEGRRNWLFYAGEFNLEYYKGTNVLSEEEMANWLDKMKKLQEICDEKDIQLLYMIMPTKEQVYPEYMPTLEIENKYKRVPRFLDYVKNNSDINIIYPLEELIVAKKYWQVYYKHDTHWNNVGGFIGTQAALKALGKDTTNLLDIPIKDRKWNSGDLISLGNLNPNIYSEDRDYDIVYKPEINDVWKSGIVDEVYCVKSTSPNNQKMVMVGDSFRIHVSNYIYKEFAESTFLHRDFLGDEMVQEDIRNADVLIVSANERYDALMVQSVDEIIDILSK